jgi:hypothetical protein
VADQTKRGGDMGIWRWQRFIVEALVGASAVALFFSAIGATAEPILAAVALVGIALLLAQHDATTQAAGDTVPQPLRAPTQPESARPEPPARAGFDAAIVEAASA